MLDYLFLPMVITLIGAVYLQSMLPEIPEAVWIVAILALTTSVNWIGLKLADKTNIVLLLVQIGYYARKWMREETELGRKLCRMLCRWRWGKWFCQFGGCDEQNS